MEKIVIFGTGKYYQNRKADISNAEIIAFLDNDSSKWNTSIDGVNICSPEMIDRFNYDKVLIMSTAEQKMREQLLKLGVEKEKIWNWILFNAHMQRGKLKIYGGQCELKGKKKILLIAIELNYDGSTVAIVHTMNALKTRGYSVVLATPAGNEFFIQELRKNGNIIIVCPALRYLYEEELLWIQTFDVILVNTFPMIASACQISSKKPVLWWIHECAHETENHYLSTINRYWNMNFEHYFPQITIRSVSQRAALNFKKYYPDMKLDILTYGIPDYYEEDFHKKSGNRMVFAIIGTICERKAQKNFVQAVKMFDPLLIKHMEFWIIGRNGNNVYYDELCKIIDKEDNIKICGEKTREEMDKIYQDIDVVVCASLEETMSVVVTESMMYAKPCLTTDATGMADFIENNKNGLICKAGDICDLYEKMYWMTQNKEALEMMGRAARKTYEKYFTMEKFAERLENAIEDTMNRFYSPLEV